MLKNKARAVSKSSPDHYISMQQMKLAVNAVLEGGETPTCVARKFGICRFNLLTSLLREKKRLNAKAYNTNGGNSGPSRKLFQSKFTTNQLLSAKHEEDLARYLKQCYEMQLPINNQHNLPLLSEEAVRSMSYTFIRMHNLRYPSAWEAKQQASPGWLNGYIDRNPEIIEFVKLSLKVKRNDCQQQSSNILHYIEKITKNADDNAVPVAEDRQVQSFGNGDQYDWNFPGANSICVKIAPEVPSSTLPTYEIKEEPSYNLTAETIDNRDYDAAMENVDFMNSIIPELVYNNTESTTAAQAIGSIAENVKRRTTRKARKLSEHHCGGKEKEAETIKYKLQSHQINTSQNDTNAAKHTVKAGLTMKKDPMLELNESIHKMHGDVNYLLQSILMEMTENNRLLRSLIAGNV